MKQRAEITFETEEIIVFRKGPRVVDMYCGDCERTVQMATAQAAALLSGLTEREIFRRIENGYLHFTEFSCLLICMRSLNSVFEEIKL